MKSLMILYGVVLHYVWAVTLIIDSSALNITAFYALERLAPNAYIHAPALICASTMALWSRNHETDLNGLLLLMPQQFILCMTALGAFVCIFNSSYADGVQRPIAFIFADQFPSILGAVLHTWAIVEIYSDKYILKIMHDLKQRAGG